MIASIRSPGLTENVSQSNGGAERPPVTGDDRPSVYPWLCHGCIMIPSFMKRTRTVSPCAARTGTTAGKPWPLIVKPPSVSFEIQMYSRSYSACGSGWVVLR
jgi:hypothetical protein